MPPSDHEGEKIERLRRAMYSRTYADKLGPRERRVLENEPTGVPEDWQHKPEPIKPEDLPLEAMLRPQRRKKGAYSILKFALLAAAVFFVGAILFFGYYLFFGGASSISARNIDIAITGPAQIAGGEPVNLQVTVTNHNREPLDEAALVVEYPAGTRLDPASCSESSCRIALGTIAPGNAAAIKLPAVYQGTAGQRASVHMEVEYRLGGSDSTFVAESDYGFVFTSSPLSIAVEGNTETVSGQPMRLVLTVLSNASQPVPDAILTATYPFGFRESSVQPQAAAQGVWNLGTLNPGDKKEIVINGSLSGETGDSRVFQFKAGSRESPGSNKIGVALSETQLPMTIAQPFLDLDLAVNNSTDPKAVAVTPGSTVHVAVTYKNNLSTSIENAVVVAKLSGISVNGTTVRSDNGFYRSTDNAVLWDKTTTDGELSHLDSGATGKLVFTFQVPHSELLANIQNPTLVISVNAAGERLGETGVPENLQSTVQQKIAVASNLQMRADALYFTNPFGVTGNMPPMAGIETAYAVVFSITNTTNAITGARVTAQLPPYVRLIGNHYLPASEKVTFNGNTGSFTWDVGEVAAGAGTNGAPPRQVVIEVGFTPSTSQIGTQPVLMQDIKLTGSDSLTGDDISKTVENITTNISGDPGFSSSNATVVAPGFQPQQ
ncbi:hypothetical protein C4568_00745 [Candidatus Parcubacteria bacterium]|nr:MAG: hypothetical protein C4568_00745 [Candidatus Parcubacteria bacterium]